MQQRSTPINQLSWFGAHNAFNSTAETEAVNNLNQTLSIPQLLDAGVRAFMIDVHGKEAWVSHLTASFSWEDLPVLLAKFRSWLDAHPDQVVMIQLEPGAEVPLAAITGPFEAAFANGADSLLYLHPAPNIPWPSLDALAQARKQVIVFRETDDGKGPLGDARAPGWYHDMWAHWTETPYATTTWGALCTATWQLTDRGARNGAAFFNLNHFDQYNVINEANFLFARAMVAWKMNGRRPTISLDYVQAAGALNDNQQEVGGLSTVQALNEWPAVSGWIRDRGGRPVVMDIAWSGVARLRLGDHTGSAIIRGHDDGPGSAPATSRQGWFCFPGDGAGVRIELTPAAAGYRLFVADAAGQPTVDESFVWDGTVDRTVNLVAEPIDAVVKLGDALCGLRLGSRDAYLGDCHQTHSGGTYYAWWHGAACRHSVVALDGTPGAALQDGATVYLQTLQDDMGSCVYLSANTQFDLSYSNDTSALEEWIVERVDGTLSGPIQRGEALMFKSVEQTAQQGVDAYLSAEFGNAMFYVGTRPASGFGEANCIGTTWIID